MSNLFVYLLTFHLCRQIKHDNQDCRVMYREGPTGTPFHSLLAEGYVDGPLDVCKFDQKRFDIFALMKYLS